MRCRRGERARRASDTSKTAILRRRDAYIAKDSPKMMLHLCQITQILQNCIAFGGFDTYTLDSSFLEESE